MDTVYLSHAHGWHNTTWGGDVGVHCSDVFASPGLVSLFSVLASSLSLVALVFAFITFSLFSEVRGTAGTAITNLLAALFMAQLLYVVAVAGPPHLPQGAEGGLLCLSLVAAQHYMRIAALCWLLVIAMDVRTTFKDNLTLITTTLTPHQLTTNFIKSSLLGWGIPLTSAGLAAALERPRDRDDCCVVEASSAALLVLAATSALLTIATFVYLSSAYLATRAAVLAQVEVSVRSRVMRTRSSQLQQIAILTVLISTTCALAVASSTHLHWLASSFHTAAGLQGVSVTLALLGPACCCCCPRRWWSLVAPSRSTNHKRRRGSDRPGSLLAASPSPSLQMLMAPNPNLV